MRQIPILIIPLAGMLLLAGCGKSGANAGDYYPLSTGSTWSYHVYWQDSTGRRDTTRAEKRYTARIVGKTTIASGKDGFAVAIETEGPAPTVETMYVRRDGGFITSCGRGDARILDTIVAVPPAAGKSWHRLYGGRMSVPTHFAGQEAVTVPAGTYPAAWRTDEGAQGMPGHASSWFVPGVGLVKEAIWWQTREGGTGTMLRELTSALIR